MKSKILGLFFCLAILLSIAGIVALSVSVSTPAVLTKSVNSTTFTITNPEASTLNIALAIPSTISDGSSSPSSIAISTPNLLSFQLTPGNTTTITINRASVPSAFDLGSFSSTITVTATNSTNASISTNSTISLQFANGFCDSGSSTNTTRYIEITNVKDLSSDDDWEWKPGDDVEIEVKARYRNTEDDDDEIDAVIKLGLYDTEQDEFIEFDDEDQLERDVTLEEGTTTEETLTISVPIEDIEDAAGRYKLYVKVYEDGEEDTICDDTINGDYFQSVAITKESYEVILKDIEVEGSVTCGEEVTVTAKAWNIGTNDEDKVYISAYNKDLGIINTNSSVFSLDEGEVQTVSFTFLIPKDVSEKTYTAYLTAHFKYSKSSETYREISEDPFAVQLKVEDCVPQGSPAIITADFSSETPRAIIGSQVIIEATVKNTGTSQATYDIEVTGNSAWSELADVDPESFTLDAGESKKVSIYLDVNKDAAVGEEEFTISAVSGSKTTEQKVQIELESGFSSNAILDHLKNNWFIYTIILVNVILIIAIIIAITRIFRK